MAEDRSRRFARLRADAGPGDTLDLFEHFGVPSDPTAPDGAAMALSPPLPARGRPFPALPCPQCGWFRATPLVEPCPICAAPGRTGGSQAGAEGEG